MRGSYKGKIYSTSGAILTVLTQIVVTYNANISAQCVLLSIALLYYAVLLCAVLPEKRVYHPRDRIPLRSKQ